MIFLSTPSGFALLSYRYNIFRFITTFQGALTGLLAGLAQLNCSEITLRQLDFKQGILGRIYLPILSSRSIVRFHIATLDLKMAMMPFGGASKVLIDDTF